MATNGGPLEARGEEPRGYVDDKDALLRRLSRIEGQVRGVRGMVSEEAYCIDVITQISAISRALDGVALKLLEDHTSHCVRGAVERGGDEADEKLDEIVAAMQRFARTR
jgi:CsoR family transcriptional regulator, copper-sensing transcriptional repressor